MAEISTKLVFDGITLALHKAFPSAKIHSESIEQGLGNGDMLVTSASMSESSGIGSRLNRFPAFDIAYFGADNEDNIEAADDIVAVLRLITLPTGDRLRGTGITSATVDGVLHITVNYDYRAYYPEPSKDKMTALEVKNNG